MLLFNQDKRNCTGCSACYSVCPKRCIRMVADEEGFLYPESNNSCIHCGLCEKVCPSFIPKRDITYAQRAVAAVSKNYQIWKRSSSGGAFSEICRHWADKETLIVGAAWDGLRVHHIGVKGFNSIAPLCKSKYISSAIEDTFIEIRKHLSSGRKALFCGCPCQVAGLKAYLQKEYDNLLTIDLICHGQGSPSVFKACVDHLSDYFGGEIQEYQFRAKRRLYEKDYMSSIKIGTRVIFIEKDPYIQLFLTQNALRPSCGANCKYRDSRRPGDLTIADFKGLSRVFPDLNNTKKNWSSIICNTRKGEQCFLELEETMEVRPCLVEDIVKYNPLFAHQTWFSNDRDNFFADFEKNPSLAISKWTIPAKKVNRPIKKEILSLIPDAIKKFFHFIIR